MVNDWLNTYKYGWKTSYYQNTYDTSNYGVEEEKPTPTNAEYLLAMMEGDDYCDSCKI